MIMMMRLSLIVPLLMLSPLYLMNGATAADDHSICTSESGIFTVKVDLYAGELGYYTFEECGPDAGVNPTIGMEIGKTYTFVQSDRSNYYHPLGFAYYPDGAHADVDELEPGIAPPGTGNACDAEMSCPAPMYHLDQKYLGVYSNIDMAVVTTGNDATENAVDSSSTSTAAIAVKSTSNSTTITNHEDFGLDAYEPLFFRPLPDWAGMGEFSIKLNFDEEYDQDIFYFCHIHQYMTGRIKLLKDGTPVSEEDKPSIEYSYDQPGDFDAGCGTHGLDEFQLPHKECPTKFVCDVDPSSANANFANCIDAMNCHMFSGMTSYMSSNSKNALFIHEMIPHHQNAVNMAKTLLHENELDCPDLTDDENEDCALEVILREIINVQNHQIQLMRGVLEEEGWPMKDDCVVNINSLAG